MVKRWGKFWRESKKFYELHLLLAYVTVDPYSIRSPRFGPWRSGLWDFGMHLNLRKVDRIEGEREKEEERKRARGQESKRAREQERKKKGVKLTGQAPGIV